MFADVPANSIILIEDIDCVFEKRKQTEDNESKVTFSGLLNAIDGVVAGEGRILFMTTNHIEKLDAALIRDGRCDVRILIENANADQARRLFLRFFPGENTLADQFGELVGQHELCMAALQGHLLKYSEDAVSAVSHISELLNEPKEANEVSERTQGELGVQATPTSGTFDESEAVCQDDSCE
jgi:chaperone BCS1